MKRSINIVNGDGDNVNRSGDNVFRDGKIMNGGKYHK